MRVVVALLEFSSLISKIRNVVTAKPSVPILANVLLEARDEELIIEATDLTTSVRASCSAEVETPGSVTLPANRLIQLSKELTSQRMTLAVDENFSATLETENSSFKIPGASAENFPEFPDLSAAKSLSFPAKELKEILFRTTFSAAKDDSRHVLNSLYLQQSCEQATFVCTDGRRLSRNQVALKNKTEYTVAGEPLTYLLPLKAVEEINRLLDQSDEIITLLSTPQKIGLKVDSVFLVCKLLNGEYPDVSKVIPQLAEAPIILHREELLMLLRQVSIFTSDSNVAVRFVFENGLLHLSAMSGDIGEGRAAMNVNYFGPKFEIAFNPQYFIDILRHTKDEVISFHATDSYSPGLITDSMHSQFVIMPMHFE